MSDVKTKQHELSRAAYDRFVRYRDLKDLGIPFSRQHLDVLEDLGRFPRRVKLSDRIVAWRLSELQAWMDERGRE
jgi:prophage regulatory protein